MGVTVLGGGSAYFLGFYLQEPHLSFLVKIQKDPLMAQAGEKSNPCEIWHGGLHKNGLLPKEDMLPDSILYDSSYKTFWKDKTMIAMIIRSVVVRFWRVIEGLNKWSIGEFLGWWNYTVWYCNCGFMTLCVCQNSYIFVTLSEPQCIQIKTSHLGSQRAPGWNVHCKKRI